MFLFYLYLIILIFGLVIRNNKLFYLIQLAFIFLLMAGNTDNADYLIYFNRYDNVELFSSNTEWLFNNIINFSKNLGLSYEVWRVIVSLVYCSIIGIIIFKIFKEKCNIVLSLMMIYSIFIDNVQLRQTIAMVLGFVAIYLLFKYKDTLKKWNVIISVLLFILAGGIHASAYLYILVIIPFIVRRRESFVVICIITTIFFLLLTFNIDFLSKIGEFLVSKDKMSIVFSEDQVDLSHERTKRVILVVLISLIYLLPYIYNKFFQNKPISPKLDCIFGMNIILLLAVIPLIFVDLQFYRIFQILILFNIIGCTKMLDNCEAFSTTRKNICFVATTSSVLIACLYLLVLSNTNIETVFWAIFQNNIIF